MAAGQGFKTFATGDVLTSTDVNGYLMQGVLVFANAAARDASITSPQQGQVAFLKDTNATQYYSGTAWVAIGGGGGGGKVLQVVYGSTLTTASTTSTSFSDTNLTATITPTLNTSKILVIVNQTDVNKTPGDINTAVNLRINRGATALLLFSTGSGYTGSSSRSTVSSGATYLDAPATTSATTYKTQFSSTVSGQTVYCQYFGDEYSTITLLEIGA